MKVAQWHIVSRVIRYSLPFEYAAIFAQTQAFTHAPAQHQLRFTKDHLLPKPNRLK
jgi:hypothetical protein